METNRVITGDALEELAALPSESVHAVVTDPPYGLEFMGRSWDDFEPREYQEWCEQWATLALEVLKPGGHLLAFSGNRTHHRLFCGVEDAGYEVRDTLTWHYGSGFPKALDVSKAIQKANGVEPESVDPAEGVGFMNDEDDWNDTHHHHTMPDPEGSAAEWSGWKTALKPATEFIVLARKPFDGTVAECVQAHGTAALNIDGTRIGYDSDGDLEETQAKNPGRDETVTSGVYGDDRPQQSVNGQGRYPANVIFDADAAAALDREVGELTGGAYTPENYTGRNTSDAPTHNDPDERQQLSGGGPSRYFYTSKATRAERTENGRIDNAHPTVKPQDLMEWLVRLVTAEGQIVLDPFAGSGTTLKAAKALGREFIGIEQQPKWADVARVRAGLTPHDPANVRDTDADQQGLEAFTDGGGREE